MRNSDEPPLAPAQAGMPDYRGMALGELSGACEAKGIDIERRGGDWIRRLESDYGIGSTPA